MVMRHSCDYIQTNFHLVTKYLQWKKIDVINIIIPHGDGNEKYCTHGSSIHTSGQNIHPFIYSTMMCQARCCKLEIK